MTKTTRNDRSSEPSCRLFVQLEDFCRAHAERESNRYDPAGGRAGDQIKIAPDWLFKVVLQVGQERDWKDTPNSVAIDREYPLQRMSFLPIGRIRGASVTVAIEDVSVLAVNSKLPNFTAIRPA